jgi:hypothetical protein
MCLVLVAGYAFERYHSRPATAGIAPPITDTQARPSSPPGSLERLNDVVLRASDLPGDWTSNPYQADPNNDAGQAAFAKCIGTMASNPDVVAEAHSDDFSLGQMTISSSATSYRTQATVQSDTAALQRPRLSTCFTQLMQTVLKSTLPTGSTLDSPSFRITPRSAGDPRGVVATATGSVKISVDGRHLTAYMAFGFIAGPKIEADVDAFNIDAPIPPQLMNAMVTKVASRATRS